MEEPDVVSITQQLGDDFQLPDLAFTTDNNNFNGLTFNSYDGADNWGIRYDTIADDIYTNYTTKDEVHYCGYSNAKKQFGQQGVSGDAYTPDTYEWVEVINYKTITITSDYNLSTTLGDEEAAEISLAWFTANTTKLS